MSSVYLLIFENRMNRLGDGNLKRKICAVLRKGSITFILISLCLTLSCCTADCTCTDLLAYILDYHEQSGYSIFFSGGETKNSITSEKLAELYSGIDPSQICESYAICLSGHDSIFEIHIYRPSGDEKVDQVEKTLRRRLELLQSRDVQLYDSDMYDETVASGEVWSSGGFCFLLLTDDNAAAKKRACELMR